MKFDFVITALALWANGACAYKPLTPQRVADDIKAEEYEYSSTTLFRTQKANVSQS